MIKNSIFSVLDTAQLTRIESVHRGFLYQHLYAVGCLLLAQEAGVDTVKVELDEDIELTSERDCVYIQVKTRSKPIIPSNILGAIERFEEIRKEHADGKRSGKATLIIVANQEPSDRLQQAIDDKELPPDVIFVYPESTEESHPALPPAWESLTEAVEWCVAKAEQLNFSLLSADTLIWKLAGLVQLAATGGSANRYHEFHAKDLPILFEQLIVQLQNFPAPPALYRPQKMEPLFISDERIRIICGLSGAGKTAWAAQAALHCAQTCSYYDVGDLPGPALASSLVRELAAKFITPDPAGLREILLPGASGYESLSLLDTFLEQQGKTLLVVLDNAHRIPVENLRDVLTVTKNISFILLSQPNDNVRELEAIMGLKRQTLLGWDIDTVAQVVAEHGGIATVQGFEQLRLYTGGLPLYVQSAIQIAVTEYDCNVDDLCAELHKQENSVETAQEIILSRVYSGFEGVIQDALALFSLTDVGLNTEEISNLLVNSLELSKAAAASIFKKILATGTVEMFGNQTFKVHDAVRTLGLQHFELMDEKVTNSALIALKKVLITSLYETRDTSRLALLTQIYVKLNDVMSLIALTGEELFHEMGITVDILASLEQASISNSLEPMHKFWALDGLVFSEIREGSTENLASRFDAMAELLSENDLGFREELAYNMKRILYCAEKGESDEVERLVENTISKMPDTEHELIFQYNHAIALWKLKRYKDSEVLCRKVIGEYYDLLGISPQDVMGKNSDVLWLIIERPDNVQEHLKHLADALELHAIVRGAQDKPTPFNRIHSMKFYNMVGAADSMVRVGQDLADEFVARKDYVGAREVMEQHVLPVVNQANLVKRLVQVRSQYAVILALCGEHAEAAAEMQCLRPYIEGLTTDQRREIESQSHYIEQLAVNESKGLIKKRFGKVGRNEKCPCGSSLKYKKCHGA